MTAGWKGFLKQVAWSLPVAIAFTDCIACVIRVDGQSMQPTLNPDPDSRDWVLVEKVTYKLFHRYKRGEVAVFWAPDDPHQQLVKRMIAVEGDMVWEEGKRMPTRISAGRCWMEGDNPHSSGDSRNLYGPVHLGLLEGRATHVVWPPSRMQRLPPYVPPGRVVEDEGDSLARALAYKPES